MTNKELIKLLKGDETKVVLAKKKKSGYTVLPHITEVVTTELPIIGDCKVIVFES